MTLSLTTTTMPPRVHELLAMLTYRRPALSMAEENFIENYIAPLGAVPDEYGNHWLTIGSSPILWSCHTDTVHRKQGMQRVLYGADVASADSEDCLGADCTVGVWIMVNMIRAGIPGTYVFHACEEIGGLGSSYIAKETPERLTGIQFAIAFDRRGTNEIITHQAGARCASEAFAASLADVLAPLHYHVSDGGTFTDTANYTDLISECTNIGVGYYNQHTKNEYQDIHHATALLDRILVAPWDRLVCAREPGEIDLLDWGWHDGDEIAEHDSDNLLEYIVNNPEDVADFLFKRGFSVEDIARNAGH